MDDGEAVALIYFLRKQKDHDKVKPLSPSLSKMLSFILAHFYSPYLSISIRKYEKNMGIIMRIALVANCQGTTHPKTGIAR